MEIKKASRLGVRPLIGFYSESGCGKTYSSLLLARGFVGPEGKIVMVDTESGRGSLYADVLPGGYDTLELREPFSPSRYIEAIQAVEKSGATIGIIDSCSHEWEGLGGVLDLAGQSEEKSGKAGLHNWRQPKLEHAKFMLRLLQSTLPWIVCLRAKFKSRQSKENGKTVIYKDEQTTPIQSDEFIFEMTVHGEIMPNHSFRLTKCSHPALRQAMPNNEPVTIEHGKLLAKWCAAPGAANASNGAPTKAELLTKLRDLTTEIHGWRKGMKPEDWQKAKVGLENWLGEHKLLALTEKINELDENRLAEILAEAEKIIEIPV